MQHMKYKVTAFILMAQSILLLFQSSNAKAQLVSNNTVDLRPLFYPVKNQGKSNAGALFALSSAMESKPGIPRLSESAPYLRFQTKSRTKPENQIELKDLFLFSTGISPLVFYREDSDNAFLNTFSTLRKISKHTSNSDYLTTIEDLLEKTESYKTKELGYTILNPRYYPKRLISTEWIIKNLRKKKPIIIEFKFNEAEWINGMKNPHFEFIQNVDDDNLYRQRNHWSATNHSALIVGYRESTIENRKSIEYIIRNSWGPGWGDEGYGYLSEARLLEIITGAMTFDNALTYDNRMIKHEVIFKTPYELKANAVIKKSKSKDDKGQTYDLYLSLIKNESYSYSTVTPLSISYRLVLKKNNDLPKNKSTKTEVIHSIFFNELSFTDGVVFEDLQLDDLAFDQVWMVKVKLKFRNSDAKRITLPEYKNVTLDKVGGEVSFHYVVPKIFNWVKPSP
jgi:hypothetical protein